MTEVEKKQVAEAVQKVRALRTLGKSCSISTTRSQATVLKALPDVLLIAVAEELEKTGEPDGAQGSTR